MIVFNLQCENTHEFEVWFRNSADYDDQVATGAVHCPSCNSAIVEKALMAPNIAPKKSGKQPYVQAPSHVHDMLRAVHKQITENCDYVGDSFAREARAIHEGDSEERSIYGEATREDAIDLIEDGIEVSAIPTLPKADA